VADGESVLTQRLDPHAADEIVALYREIFEKEAPVKQAPTKAKAATKAKAPTNSRKKART